MSNVAGKVAIQVEVTDAQRVDQWRWDRALALGCDSGLAHMLVTHPEVDLHRFEDMVANACPHELAFAILQS